MLGAPPPAAGIGRPGGAGRGALQAVASRLFQLSLAPGERRPRRAVAGRPGDARRRLVQSPDYKGSARTPQDYVRESIVNPHAYLVPGPTFSFGGRSIMPAFDTILKPEEIDQLVAYLVTFK